MLVNDKLMEVGFVVLSSRDDDILATIAPRSALGLPYGYSPASQSKGCSRAFA